MLLASADDNQFRHVMVGKREAQRSTDGQENHLRFKLAPLAQPEIEGARSISAHRIRALLRSCNTSRRNAATAVINTSNFVWARSKTFLSRTTRQMLSFPICVINLSRSKLRVSQGSSARASSAVQTFDVHALQVILAVIVLR